MKFVQNIIPRYVFSYRTEATFSTCAIISQDGGTDFYLPSLMSLDGDGCKPEGMKDKPLHTCPSKYLATNELPCEVSSEMLICPAK